MKSTKAARLFWTIVGGIPLAVPVAMAIFGTILTILLLTHNFSGGPILLASVLLVIPAVLYVFKIYNHDGPGTQSEKNIFNVLAVLFVLGWIVFNAQYTAQSVFIDRDPGFYNVAGKWLASHDSSDVRVDMIFGNDENLTAQEGGMWLKAGQQPSTSSSHTIQPQGMHLFSAVLGVSGRIAGDPLMLRTGVIIGGLALLAFYGFARLVIRPRWAVLAMGVLAFSMPMIYFSRDTYTEPLALLFAFGGLALLYSASNRLPKINPFLLVLAGLSTGATALARADGYFVVIACVIFFCNRFALQRKKPACICKISGVVYAGSFRFHGTRLAGHNQTHYRLLCRPWLRGKVPVDFVGVNRHIRLNCLFFPKAYLQIAGQNQTFKENQLSAYRFGNIIFGLYYLNNPAFLAAGDSASKAFNLRKGPY